MTDTTKAGGDAGRAAARPGTAKSAPTIYDIAVLAGVNPSTVSRALSKPGRVSAKTAQKITDAAQELNYQVNVFARALPTGRTQTVGLIVSDITNPAYFEVIRGAETAASGRDYTLMLAESAESAELELTAARRMLATVDGLILASPRLSDEEIGLLASKKPVVVINRSVAGVASVVADTEVGVTDAVRHLAAMGHTAISYVAGPERSWMSQRRWESIKARCDWHGMQATVVASLPPTVDGGRRAAAGVRAGAATAVFCYNDLMAIGLMRELQSAGLTIPEELSILGFDNIFGSDFTTPPLSTIKSPLHELGVSAFRRVLDAVDQVDAGQEPPAPPTELVLRGSTGRAKGA
ncbi:LacI family transcriptional regulator [Arthrobacter livingstonensis]|uniref:LacI family transcriptional regulator n=1 Tax=Arthrobacter livingstonensis TaxID=670078 RepID=A0A2V5LBB9_9MICC|nr:LacI family DNA-binding transcriptional regulator [Arthrobacter livingstonensis]PYI68648.1 LacI family transcriptional regulator [Arthrobacter livingstonensis]